MASLKDFGFENIGTVKVSRVTSFVDYNATLKCENGVLKIRSYIDTDYGTKEEQEPEIRTVEYWNNRMKRIDPMGKYGKVKSIEITWM